MDADVAAYAVQDTTQGRWVFQWLWELNTNEWYTTCWDAVISETAPGYTAPPHPTRGSLARTSTEPSAGLSSTTSWAATPISGRPDSSYACEA